MPDFRPGLEAEDSNKLLIVPRSTIFGSLVDIGRGDFVVGMNFPRISAIHAAMKDTEIVCTWRRARLPVSMERRMTGSSSCPTLDAVPRREDRFISRFPLRLRTVGTMIMSWSTSFIARQCCRDLKLKMLRTSYG